MTLPDQDMIAATGIGVDGRRGSRFVGVSWDKNRQKWLVKIGMDGGYRHLGRFDDEVAAAHAYDEAARKALGRCARLNFPNAEDAKLAATVVDRNEARRMFGISLPAWKRWEDAGLIPCIKTSYRVFYDIEELKRLLPELGPIEPPYPDPRRPGVYRVPLIGRGPYRRQGEAIIDAQSLPLVQDKHCCLSSPESSNGGYVAVSCEQGGTVPLHRLIMDVTDAAFQVGHANGDPLDCRRENLVVRTIQERLFSARKRESVNGEPCTSPFKGVSWRQDQQIWRARIRLDGKERYLGRFDSEIEAAEAYDAAARMHFGEHAWLNFPGEGERGGANQQDADDLSLSPVRMAA